MLHEYMLIYIYIRLISSKGYTMFALKRYTFSAKLKIALNSHAFCGDLRKGNKFGVHSCMIREERSNNAK